MSSDLYLRGFSLKGEGEVLQIEIYYLPDVCGHLRLRISIFSRINVLDGEYSFP
jgi:hypothetical protein